MLLLLLLLLLLTSAARFLLLGQTVLPHSPSAIHALSRRWKHIDMARRQTVLPHSPLALHVFTTGGSALTWWVVKQYSMFSPQVEAH